MVEGLKNSALNRFSNISPSVFSSFSSNPNLPKFITKKKIHKMYMWDYIYLMLKSVGL